MGAPKLIPLWIDNKEVTSSVTFPVTNSETGKVVHEVYGATPEIAIKAVESAERAFKTWRDTDPWERRRLLERAAEYLRSKHKEVTALIELETPAPPHMVNRVNVEDSINKLSELASAVPLMTNGILPHTRHSNSMVMIVKEPFGVQLGIAPWNASLLLAIRAVMTPIACGNTAILKASELSPGIHHFLGRMVADVGFPPGVLNVIQHRREDAASITEALISHPAVTKVNFTGSTNVGKAIASLAGRYCKPTLMELGGKAPQVVFADADLDKAASAAINGAFFHHGQICMGTEKVIAHESIIQDLTDRMAIKASEYSMTSAVTEAGAARTEALVQEALQKGAVRVTPKRATNGVNGTNGTESEHKSSIFKTSSQLHPTILTGVTPSMRLYSEESFGPTVSVHAFRTEEEAIDLANDSVYGLAASVFTQDIIQAIRVSKKITSGSVHINSMTIHDEPHLPHGGMKSSGWGRFGVPWAFDEFLQLKMITITSDSPI